MRRPRPWSGAASPPIYPIRQTLCVSPISWSTASSEEAVELGRELLAGVEGSEDGSAEAMVRLVLALSYFDLGRNAEAREELAAIARMAPRTAAVQRQLHGRGASPCSGSREGRCIQESASAARGCAGGSTPKRPRSSMSSRRASARTSKILESAGRRPGSLRRGQPAWASPSRELRAERPGRLPAKDGWRRSPSSTAGRKG